MAKIPLDPKKFLEDLSSRNSSESAARGAEKKPGGRLSGIPEKGLIRIAERTSSLSNRQKALLTRKANQLYNAGELDQAERIYLTVGYSGGLSKLGRHYLAKNDFIRAMLLFLKADERAQLDTLSDRFAMVIRKWLRSDRKPPQKAGIRI